MVEGVRSYHDGALEALRFLEHRAPSGRDADLWWASFRGHFADVHRIELLLRESDAEWPGSLGARRVFDLCGVAEDDAFGKDWVPLDPVIGADLWHSTVATAPPEEIAQPRAVAELESFSCADLNGVLEAAGPEHAARVVRARVALGLVPGRLIVDTNVHGAPSFLTPRAAVDLSPASTPEDRARSWVERHRGLWRWTEHYKAVILARRSAFGPRFAVTHRPAGLRGARRLRTRCLTSRRHRLRRKCFFS